MSDVAYFDNAATTFPKPEEVYSFADATYRSLATSIGRGDFSQARAGGSLMEESKSALRKLLACEGKDVVYTASATDALNRILLGLDLRGGIVYASPFEHNAVTRILHHLEETAGITVKLLPFDGASLLLEEEEMLATFESNAPKAVVMTHASNVCGAILPVETVCEAAKRYGATTVVDMSQTAGIVPLRLNLPYIDFAVFAGHKTLFAPFGIGGFVCSAGEKRLRPVFFGGDGIDSLEQRMPSDIVHMEEIGSRNTYAIAGLLAGTKWLLEHDDAREVERARTEQLLRVLRSYPNLSIVANSMECPRTGVVSCVFDGYAPDEIGSVLSDLGVAVRAGLHCSPYAHRFLGTLPLGTVRFSVSPLTTEDDMDHLERALDHIRENG